MMEYGPLFKKYNHITIDGILKDGYSYYVEEFLKQHQAIHRFGRPEEVADLVLFLSSEKAGFICASNIPVDGGNM